MKLPFPSPGDLPDTEIKPRSPVLLAEFYTLNHQGRPYTHSVQLLSCVWPFATPWTTAHQASLSITNCGSLSQTARVYPDPSPLSRWWDPTISSSVVPFSSCPQSFPTWGSFEMSQLFASGGQSIGFSASTSVFPMKTQDWSPLGWSGWISWQSKGLSRVCFNTTVKKNINSSVLSFL